MATTFGRILIRRDTAANWSALNPILASGEPGWDTTNLTFKVGDGTSHWNDLTSIDGGGGGGGISLPAGGTTGQALVKNSNTSGDAGWSNTVPNASTATALATARTIAGQSFNGTANISIASTNLSDFSTTSPSDGLVPSFDDGSGTYVPKDLTEVYTLQDSSGRLDPSAWQKYFTPTVIVNSGDPAPSDFPVGGIVFERTAPVSLVPLLRGTNFANSSTVSTLTVTNTADLAVNDWIGIATMFDGTNPPGTLPTLISSITPATGAWTLHTDGPEAHISATVQCNILYAKVGTLIPSGTVITMTLNQTRTHRAIALFKMPNLDATTPLDQQATASGASSSTLSISVGPTSATTVADELSVLVFGHSDSTTATRPIVGTNGFTVLAAIESDNGVNSRTLTALYRVETATGTKTGTANVNASDGATGAWSGTIATFKKA